MYITWN